MKNRLIKIDDEEIWISRSIGVSAIVLAQDTKGKWYVLSILRSKNSESFPRYWSLPGGYLDYDETLVEGCVRELKEETGVKLDKTEFKLHSIDSSPENFKQNIIVRFISKQTKSIDQFALNPTDKEGEVEFVRWIGLDDINSYIWAFNFKNVLLELKAQV